ncbi:TIGR03086 family metal-binding protein [Streptomyces sp. NBC_01334]|uniref:TIGR03086 family metal-binding protein n=1 Tax=Streptomyces sp. NBC_01334 TaxID=2903827 RepID=UPI002E145897|nr:TIGR03086 family metal-binding protein [Streptomyces sp. NBC_01334]
MKYDETHQYMSECAAEASRVARGVPAARLNDPTHCQGWDVRTLVDHWVLYTSHGLEHRALRKQLPDDLVARDFTADPQWAEAYTDQLERAVAAWAEPSVWEGEVDLGTAAMPAAEIAAMIVKEMAVHGWDVAVATDQEFRISDDAARFVLDVVERHGDLYRQYDGFAAVVPVAQDAPVFERALAASGRDPRQGAARVND